jgi:hypothetical protein
MKRQRYTAEDRRQIKKYLMFRPSPDWSETAPQYTGSFSSDEVTKRCRAALNVFLQAAVDFESSDRQLLLEFLRLNSCDLTNPDTYFSAWSYITTELGIEPEPQPAPAPVVPAPAPEPVAPRNPFPVNSFEWHRRDRQIMVEDSIREVSPLVRDTLQEIATASGLKIPQSVISEMLECFDAARPRMLFNRENLRRCFIKRFFSQFKNPENVFTPEEIREWHMDNFRGTAQEFAGYFGLGNPGMRTSD